jgi:hypothetical protein
MPRKDEATPSKGITPADLCKVEGHKGQSTLCIRCGDRR